MDYCTIEVKAITAPKQWFRKDSFLCFYSPVFLLPFLVYNSFISLMCVRTRNFYVECFLSQRQAKNKVFFIQKKNKLLKFHAENIHFITPKKLLNSYKYPLLTGCYSHDYYPSFKKRKTKEKNDISWMALNFYLPPFAPEAVEKKITGKFIRRAVFFFIAQFFFSSFSLILWMNNMKWKLWP